MAADIAVLVTARDEAGRLGATLAALGSAFPTARILVADDGSRDGSPELARAAGAEVVRSPRRIGKGAAATLGARALLEGEPRARTVVLCDGDLGATAGALVALVAAVDRGEGDVAVAAFARRMGGGFGLTLGTARRVVERLTGLRLDAPLSGQRALRADALEAVLPFAEGFGMETAMAIDAHRAGFRLVEVELPLEHRPTGRTPAGFAHRARQLRDVVRVFAHRRSGGPQRRR